MHEKQELKHMVAWLEQGVINPYWDDLRKFLDGCEVMAGQPTPPNVPPPEIWA